MDERNNKPVPQLIEVEPMQDGYRWVAITAMLLAIGIILHTVSPNVGGVTPNWTIAMYSIVINLTRPKLSQAIGIGFIAGLTLVPSSKSAFPLGNVASGGLFTFILKLILGLPLHVWIYAMLPVVAIVGLLNGLITFFLYAPVRKLFYFQEDEK